MGYTHLTDISIPISPLAYIKSAGTWTPTFDSNIVYDTRTAAAASFKLFIPVPLLGSSTLTQGSKLVKIDYNYSITTAACTAFTVKLVKQNLILRVALQRPLFQPPLIPIMTLPPNVMQPMIII